jgi:hypothetical protein
LSLYFCSNLNNKGKYAPELLSEGRELLQQLNFDRADRKDDDHYLGRIVEACLADIEDSEATKVVCENLKQAMIEYRIYDFECKDLLLALFRFQSRAALDTFLIDQDGEQRADKATTLQATDLHQSPLDEVSEATLIDWCGGDPVKRFPVIASLISMFRLSGDRSPLDWTPTISKLVHNSPDPIAVMHELIIRLHPTSWSGSRATLLQKNANLLDKFNVENNIALATYIRSKKIELEKEAQQDREWETKRDRDRDERFE